MKLYKHMLIDARHRLGMTQQEVAEKSGVSLMTVSNAENGKHVQPATGKSILKVLKLDPAVAIIPSAEESGDDAA